MLPHRRLTPAVTRTKPQNRTERSFIAMRRRQEGAAPMASFRETLRRLVRADQKARGQSKAECERDQGREAGKQVRQPAQPPMIKLIAQSPDTQQRARGDRFVR